MFKVIIAGSRTFDDYDMLCRYADHKLSRIAWAPDLFGPIEIVSGGARGADSLGERYAKDKGYKLTVFRADWDRYGKRAGYLRNVQMAEYADALLAFWDGKSRGTANMIKEATVRGLMIGVKQVKNES